MRRRDEVLTAGRVGVWGLGLEGRAALRWLDSRLPGTSSLVAVDPNHDHDLPVRRPVEHQADPAALLSCDAVLLSPGVPGVHPLRRELSAAGVLVTSGTALWLEEAGPGTIGVTGTKGKSTTTALLGHLLRESGRPVTVAGNIGVPLLDVELTAGGLAIAELSSYQCELIEVSPRIAVVTQLAADHLSWHGDQAAYWAAKARIVTRGAEVLVASEETVAQLRTVADLPATLRIEPPVPIDPSELPEGAPELLRHRHNLADLGLALQAARLVEPGVALTALAGFTPLAHRLEVVSTVRDLLWVDDSLATTPESVIAALDAYDDRPVTLLLGGSDRGIDDAPLLAAATARRLPLTVLALPDTGTATGEKLRAAGSPVRVVPVTDVVDAVRTALAVTPAGGVVLLSPGAPSHNQFRDYAEKSQAFRDAITELA